MNKEEKKEAVRLRKQNQRKRDKEDVTLPEMSHNSPNMSHPDVTLYRYIDGKRVDLDAVPPGYKVLSDGQVWKPLNPQPVVVKPVEGTTTEKAAKLLLICESLNKFNVSHLVRYGVCGPTMDVVSETLGAS